VEKEQLSKLPSFVSVGFAAIFVFLGISSAVNLGYDNYNLEQARQQNNPSLEALDADARNADAVATGLSFSALLGQIVISYAYELSAAGRKEEAEGTRNSANY
jgi:hypothetical protein